jgi:hypothetical protein
MTALGDFTAGDVTTCRLTLQATPKPLSAVVVTSC